jgi:hypothetical protein
MPVRSSANAEVAFLSVPDLPYQRISAVNFQVVF